MTRATSILVMLWFLLALSGIGSTSLPIVRGERSRVYLVGFVLCIVALAPQAPLMFLLGWVELMKSKFGDPSSMVHLPALLGMVFGPAALIAGTGRIKQSASSWILLFGLACLGAAVAVGSFVAVVFMITI